MLSSRVVIHFAIVCFVNPNYGLERSRKISATTGAIRHVVNDIFSSLRIKMNKSNKIKKYSAIHKHFVKLTRHENDNWNEIFKLSRHDVKINNGSADFTTVINEVLSDENKTDGASDLLTEDKANMYIEYFLNTLKKLKEKNFFNNSDSTENNEVLQLYYRDRNNTENNAKASAENGAKDSDVWVPSETRRIFHGQRTKIQNYPFLVSVHFFNVFTCAGSIIDRDLVITAASCLQLLHNNRFFREKPLSLTVRVGSSYYDVGGESIPAVEVYFHPLYDPSTLRNNLAIMRLRRIIKFRKKEKKIKRIEIDHNNWPLSQNTGSITLIGWGAKTTLNKVKVAWQDKLSEAQLDYYPRYECQKIYPKSQVMDKSFCAGFFSQGGGACNRDVGAPGVVHGELVGVVSFGAVSCGATAAPTVFTKVGFYADWIESIMEQTNHTRAIYTAEPTTRRRPYFYHTIEATMGPDNSFTIQPIIRSATDYSRETNLQTVYDKEFKEFLKNRLLSVNSNAQQSTVKKQAKDENKKHAQKKSTENTDSTDITFEPDPFKSTSINMAYLDIEELYGLSSPDKKLAKERDKVTTAISVNAPGHLYVKSLFDDKEGESNKTDREQAVVNSKIRSKPKLNQNTISSNYSVLLKQILHFEPEEQTISSNSLEVEQNTLPEPDLNALQELLLVFDQPSIEDFEAIKENFQGVEQKKLPNSVGSGPKKQHSPEVFHPETQNSPEGSDPKSQYGPEGFHPRTQYSHVGFDPKIHHNPEAFHPQTTAPTTPTPAGIEMNELYNFRGFDLNEKYNFKDFGPKIQHHRFRGLDRKKKHSYRDFNPQTQHSFEPKEHSNSEEYESKKQLRSDARNEVIRPPRIKIDGISLPIRKPVETSIVRQLDNQIDQIIGYINNKVVNTKVPKRVDTKIQENLQHQEQKESLARNNDILFQLYMPPSMY